MPNLRGEAQERQIRLVNFLEAQTLLIQLEQRVTPVSQDFAGSE